MDKDKYKNNVNPVIYRWIDMLSVTLVSVIIYIIFHPLFAKFVVLINSNLTVWPNWIQHIVIFFIFSSLWFVLIRLGGFHLYGFNNPLLYRYPPLWLFGLLGTIIYLFILLTSYEVQPILGLISTHTIGTDFIVFGLSLFIAFACVNIFNPMEQKQNKNKNMEDSQSKSFEDIVDNSKQLIAWLQEETPIMYPSEAMFGLSIMAKRISNILLGGQLKTVGVVGTYGSGKSSLLNLIEYYINDSRKPRDNQQTKQDGFKGDMLICRVDGWGRSYGSTAQQILSMSVDYVKYEVDCLSIINLPSNYREALSDTKGAWANIVAALLNVSNRDSVYQLKRLDRILQAARLRLIIFIEDLDRNTSDKIIKDELPSLLDRLRCLKNVSFVLAIGTEHQYSDILIKICDYVEYVS